MPLLENVHISLKEIFEVRQTPFQESELWGLLSQGVEAIHHLFLVDRAHKDGQPTNLITPSTYLCTSRGRVYLSVCSVDDVRNANVLFEDVFDSKDVRKSEEPIEKAYVYTLGYTLLRVLRGLDSKCSSPTFRVSEFQKVSPVLVKTLFSMIEQDPVKRISITDLSNLCQNLAPRFMGGESDSFIIERLYREVIDCLPENDILAYVDQQVAKENEQIIKVCNQNTDNEASEAKNQSALTITVEGDSPKNPRQRWHDAFGKVLTRKRIMKEIFSECFTTPEGLNIPLKWQNHEAYDTIVKVYYELLERRKMVELLRLSINLPVDQKQLAAGMMPKSVGDLVLLLRKNSGASQPSETQNDVRDFEKESRKPSLISYPYYQIPNRTNVGPEFVLNASKPPLTIGSSETGCFSCAVNMLNRLLYCVKCSGTTTVGEILSKVLESLNYPEEDHYLIGLAMKIGEEYFFIDNEKTVIDVQPNTNFHFRFKIYVRNLNSLRNGTTRHQFYLQLRQDLLEFSQNAESNNILIEIAGYALQAEFGNYSTDFPDPYFLLEQYLPPSVVDDVDRDELKLKLKASHCCLSGCSPDDAEHKFINRSFSLDSYGYLFYRVYLQKRDRSSVVALGISLNGIDVFEERYSQKSKSKIKKRLQSHTWEDIVKISYTDDYFCFTPKLQTITGWHVKYKFYTDDYRGKSLSLFEITIEYHRLHSSLIQRDDDKLHKIDFDSNSKALLRGPSKHGVDPPKKLMTGVKSLRSRANEVGALVKTQLNSLIASKQEPASHEKKTEKEKAREREKEKEEREAIQAVPINAGETEVGRPVGLDVPPTPPKRKKKIKPPAAEDIVRSKSSSTHLGRSERGNNSEMVQRIEQVKRSGSRPSESQESSCCLADSSHLSESGCFHDKNAVLETKHEIILRKSNGTLGLKLLNGKPSPNGTGVYVQSVNPGSVAKEGHLKPGDEIIEVNGAKLVGLDYPSAVKLLKDSPVDCHLTIKRDSTRSVNSRELDWRMPSHNHILQLSGSSNSIDEFSLSATQQDLFSSTGDSFYSDVVDATTSYDSYSSKLPDFTFDLIPNLKLNSCHDIYHFLDDANTVRISLRKNTRGIGVSFCGGVDVKTDNPVESLIRVKRIHPADPADNCGQIDVGDIIIEANGRSLVGCTKMEAVNTLHSLPDEIDLLILKPKLIPSVEQRKVAIPSPSNSFASCSTPVLEDSCDFNESTESEVTLNKINGSLGFTIVKIEGEGFFVKELIKEPAVSNGDVFAGDKILLVNGIDVSSMSHSGAISFLRSLPNTVTLNLQRSRFNPLDEGVAEMREKKSKKQLRHEARMMLSDKSRLSESPNRLKMRKDRRKSRECLLNTPECSSSEINRNASRAKSFIIKQEETERADYDLNNDINSSFIRQSSVMQMGKVQSTGSGKDPCFVRWRGTTLAEDTVDSVCEESSERTIFRDEQDSGFGESTSVAKRETGEDGHTSQVTPVTCGYSFYVTLDRRWHGRLGFSLGDQKGDSQTNACVVKAIFPNSVASKDGRIRVGDKLLEVNGESLLDKPAKEVIDNLRKIRGKVDLLFLRNVQQSDL